MKRMKKLDYKIKDDAFKELVQLKNDIQMILHGVKK